MKAKDKKGFSQFLKMAGCYKSFIVLACILSGISAVLSLCPFVCIWFIIREIFNTLPDLSYVAGITKYSWMSVVFAFLSIIFSFSASMFSHLAAFRIEKNMRKNAMHKIVTLPLGFFGHNTSGRMRKIIDDNATLTHSFLAHQLPDLASAVVMPIAILVLLFVFDWRLGIVCLIPFFLSVKFLKQMMGGDSGDLMKQYMNSLEEMNTEAVEYIRGIPVVKVFQQTVYSFKNFHKTIMQYRDLALSFAFNCRLPMVKYTITINGTFILLIPIGLLLIKNTNDYKGFLLNLIFYILFSPVCALMMNKIMHLGESYFAAKEAVNRVDELLNIESLAEVKSPQKPKNNSISFKNVSFSYPESQVKALNDINFNLPEGKTFALVGPSGGGKTTIASLIPRFWDVDEGSIKVGGIDVRQINSKQLMEQIAFVFQNNHLFKGSILENIRFGREEATREEALKAAELAQCIDVLDKFPEGLDTVIGTEGVYLSGGERQRISIARAILKDAPIVILDEATAFADPENEYQIQIAFEKLIKGKTVIIIAHRLSSIKNVDRILFLQDGEIKEQGTHNELLNKKGLYAQMWQEYQQSVQWKVGKEAVYA
ncbi:ABC transporter ATP-binding protein [Anaerosalibacter sp. Marseille-P3206]|uniref:ABC transporter ATP-binding protein n=1 Tax=Anaerosalibacter sp. Marseille-P3206 TaxID=1871005 RepID=UPI00190EA883|nr:ABC transporter ATP-binding protein [Anaerosalibacter sp. Marseille-P3206]